MPSPRQLSRDLRLGRSPDLSRRRGIVGLSFVGAAAGMVVGAYQMGLIRRLPSLPFRAFDAERVDASDYAYKRAQTPDALLMLVTYGITAVLAGAGGKHRARQTPLLPIALAAKTIYDSAVALKLGQEEWAENKALCDYCQAATVASIASVALALPEAARAVDTLMQRTGVSEGTEERRRRKALRDLERAEDAARMAGATAYADPDYAGAE
jgi:uncharacterized membrane protein